jgi:hypothetical protein
VESVETKGPKFAGVKQACEHVRSILYRLGDIWPYKKAMKDFRDYEFKDAYKSACGAPEDATWIMVQWCTEKVRLCRKAYAFVVKEYLIEYVKEVINNRGKKNTVIVRGYHRYVSYVADQWRQHYKGIPRLEDIETLIDMKDKSPNAIGSEPSVLTILIEELPDDERWRNLTFKVTGTAITTADIYGSGPDNNQYSQYSHLFQHADAYFTWLLEVGREMQKATDPISSGDEA